MEMENSDKIIVVYEIRVPSRRSKPETAQRSIETVINKIRENDFIDIINVPEIIEENYKGDPFYKSIDVVPLGQRIQEESGKEVIINKVIGHLQGKEGFAEFLKDAKETRGIKNIVLVGVANIHNEYPGPSVTEANRFASEFGVSIGNICIPTRPEEVSRMFAKTESGCSFFTTQILFEEKAIKKVLLDYDKLCKEKNMKPSRILLSFSTLEDGYDIEFFKWLGVDIHKETEKEMRDSEDIKAYCESRIKKLCESILNFKKENGIAVPLGINVAQVNTRNLESSLKLTKDLAQIKV